MPHRPMPYRVSLTDHAIEQYQLRGGGKRLSAGKLRMRLLSAIRLGLSPDPEGAVEVRIERGLRAVLLPLAEGGWICKTILPAVDVREEEADVAG